MPVRLNGSTSGYTELDAPASAGNNTLKLPSGNGVDGNILGTDGSGNLSWVNGRMVLETAKASTSGTSVDFTGIPDWVKRVTVMFNGVSTNGTSLLLFQLGTSSGFVSTGYASTSSSIAGTVVTTSSTAGFIFRDGGNTSDARTGHMVLTVLSGNLWVATYTANPNTTVSTVGSGSITLSGTLDRIRINTVNGNDTFDAGSINILYEG